jgi:bifunctional non-homologous end joining protein LigD
MVNEAGALVYLANQACVTFHCWPSRADRLTRPDRLIFDLDPSREDPDAVRHGAARIVELLSELSLEPFVMTSGSRGYHVVVPLQRRAEFPEVREFSRGVAALAAQRDPELFTVQQRKAKREDKILIDVMRNGYAHTSVAAYSVRPRPGGPVATPLRVEELSQPSTRPDAWNLRSVLERLQRDGDPWHDLRARAQTLGTARRALESALAR